MEIANGSRRASHKVSGRKCYAMLDTLGDPWSRVDGAVRRSVDAHRD